MSYSYAIGGTKNYAMSYPNSDTSSNPHLPYTAALLPLHLEPSLEMVHFEHPTSRISDVINKLSFRTSLQSLHMSNKPWILNI